MTPAEAVGQAEEMGPPASATGHGAQPHRAPRPRKERRLNSPPHVGRDAGSSCSSGTPAAAAERSADAIGDGIRVPDAHAGQAIAASMSIPTARMAFPVQVRVARHRCSNVASRSETPKVAEKARRRWAARFRRGANAAIREW